MGTRQVPLCWPEPACSVSGYSSMSLISAWSARGGTDTLLLLVTLCLQNPHRVSRTVHGLSRLIPLIHSNLPRSRLVGVSHGCHLGGPLRPELAARANPRSSGAAIHRTGTLHARARQDGSMMRGAMRV